MINLIPFHSKCAGDQTLLLMVNTLLLNSHLFHWLILYTDRGIVTGVPLESERIEVQPGDVVGFYLESSIMMMMVSSLLETILIMVKLFGSILLVVLHSTHLVCIRLVISAPWLQKASIHWKIDWQQLHACCDCCCMKSYNYECVLWGKKFVV